MNPSNTLQDLIDQTKKLPNGLLRNKLVSRLEDAKIVSELMSYQTGEQYKEPSLYTATVNQHCTCSESAKDYDCVIHGIKQNERS